MLRGIAGTKFVPVWGLLKPADCELVYVCDRLANKQDVDGALSEGDICDRLNLESLANHYETPCRVASIPVLCLEEGEYWKKTVSAIVLCSVIMVHKDTNSS